MLGEFEVIKKYLKPLAKNPSSLGLTDDAAVLQPPAGQDLVITKDVLVSDVHFFADDPPDMIAKKAIRVNLSDLVAKGAQPLGFMLGLGLPAEWKENWLNRFCQGVEEDLNYLGIDLFGGDTISHPNGILISVTMVGTVPHGQVTKRSSAAAGDRVFVTGTIGDAALGYAVRREQLPKLSPGDDSYLLGRYLLPNARIDAVQLIRDFANAAIDISDGLVADLEHLCAASRVGARINAVKVPIAESSRIVIDRNPAKMIDILTGGDDYELLFTVADSNLAEFANYAEALNIPVSEIGRIVDGKGVEVEDENGNLMRINKAGYAHF